MARRRVKGCCVAELLGGIVLGSSTNIEDLVSVLGILCSHKKLDERQAEVISTHSLIGSDYGIYASRLQDALGKASVKPTLICANDDEFRLRRERICFKSSASLWRSWPFHGQMVYEIDVTIRAPDETDAVFRFALWAEHYSKYSLPKNI